MIDILFHEISYRYKKELPLYRVHEQKILQIQHAMGVYQSNTMTEPFKKAYCA